MLAAEPYRPDPEMPWRAIAAPLARAEDALARLDERLSRSPVRDGWIAAPILAKPAPPSGSRASSPTQGPRSA
jgi:hypothetical protein